MYRAEKIKILIKEKFGSYNKFAKHMGVDRSTVTKWLNGSRQPSGPTAMRIQKALGCDQEDIYGLVQ